MAAIKFEATYLVKGDEAKAIEIAKIWDSDKRGRTFDSSDFSEEEEKLGAEFGIIVEHEIEVELDAYTPCGYLPEGGRDYKLISRGDNREMKAEEDMDDLRTALKAAGITVMKSEITDCGDIYNEELYECY